MKLVDVSCSKLGREAVGTRVGRVGFCEKGEGILEGIPKICGGNAANQILGGDVTG